MKTKKKTAQKKKSKPKKHSPYIDCPRCGNDSLYPEMGGIQAGMLSCSKCSWKAWS